MQSELKPCAHCGSAAEMLGAGPGNYFVQCTACHASSDDGSRERAVPAWNTRADPTQARVAELEARVARLKSALAIYAETFCEFSTDFEGCGKLDDNTCSGCLARSTLGGLSHD